MARCRSYAGLLAAIGVCAAITVSANATFANGADPSPLGKWRFSETASCGIDDVRAGNLLTVTDAEIRYRAVSCVRDQAKDLTTASLAALCDIGGAEPLPIRFEWRFAPDVPTFLLIQGAEQPIYRCAETTQ